MIRCDQPSGGRRPPHAPASATSMRAHPPLACTDSSIGGLPWRTALATSSETTLRASRRTPASASRSHSSSAWRATPGADASSGNRTVHRGMLGAGVSGS
jgi:hypothetical protein